MTFCLRFKTTLCILYFRLCIKGMFQHIFNLMPTTFISLCAMSIEIILLYFNLKKNCLLQILENLLAVGGAVKKS